MESNRSVLVVFISGIAASLLGLSEAGADPTSPSLLTEATVTELRGLYKQLIDAENSHDITAVRPMVCPRRPSPFWRRKACQAIPRRYTAAAL
jgi:hypothetical protein